MMRDLFRITAAIAFVILCTLLPFLPGRYDSFAVLLSMIAQLFGIVGLLLVPVGALWMASERWTRLAGKRYLFAVTALIAVSAVWIMLSLAASLESLTAGLTALALWAYAVSRLLPSLRSLKSAPPVAASAGPLYLIIVPVVATIIQLAVAGPATEFSRNRAIRNSQPLIDDIERYRIANGRYPVSLLSMWPDYKPSLIGIRQYHYEPSGDAYNLFFEQLTFRLGTREIVMYNPRDQQAMTSHAMDRLQMTPLQLELDQSRGHYALHDASQPHWKYFWFD